MVERATRAFRRHAVALVATNLLAALATSYCFVSAHRRANQGEEALLAFTDDVMMASQAQVAAERMVAVGRSYLLTAEPELLVRSQAADVNLRRALAALEQRTFDRADRRRFDVLTTAATRYRAIFANLTSDASLGADRHAVVDALRTRLIPRRDRLIDELDKFIGRRREALSAACISAREASARWSTALILLGILGTGLSLSSVWFFWGWLGAYARRIEGRRGQDVRTSIDSSR